MTNLVDGHYRRNSYANYPRWWDLRRVRDGDGWCDFGGIEGKPGIRGTDVRILSLRCIPFVRRRNPWQVTTKEKTACEKITIAGGHTMQVRKLHRILSDLIHDGHGCKEVCVDKETFKHALESDGVVILPVDHAEVKTYEMSDDDGGLKVNDNGTISQKTSLVLRGSGQRCSVCGVVDCEPYQHESQATEKRNP